METFYDAIKFDGVVKKIQNRAEKPASVFISVGGKAILSPVMQVY